MPADEPEAKAPLSAIVALARSGASEQAWALFRSSGYEQLDEPVAQSVHGRLLKDRGLRASGEERRRYYGEAAEAYRRAAALSNGATYPLINAATLSLLAGEAEKSRRLAQDVLVSIERSPDEPETPYYRAATRAEAFLLLGREQEARAELAEAIAIAPRAWEDHASTLRQFALIVEAQEGDSAWLDGFRPPRSLHFSGHMSFGADTDRSALIAQIDALLEEERIGFGFGALAAGADIIVAEALLRRGAELHVVMPGGVEGFLARSVAPYGEGWTARFKHVLDRAEGVRPVRPLTAPDQTLLALGDQIAMGMALMQARRLESASLQLMIVPGDTRQASQAQAAWAEAGLPVRVIQAARDTIAVEDEIQPTQRLSLLAVILVLLGSDVEDAEGMERELAAIQALLADGPPSAFSPSVCHGRVMLTYSSAADAARAALRLSKSGLGLDGLRVGGLYGAAQSLMDPFSGARRPAGAIVPIAEAAAASAPCGTVIVTEDFGAALVVGAATSARLEYVGELNARDSGPPIGLYAVRSPAS